MANVRVSCDASLHASHTTLPSSLPPPPRLPRIRQAQDHPSIMAVDMDAVKETTLGLIAQIFAAGELECVPHLKSTYVRVSPAAAPHEEDMRRLVEEKMGFDEGALDVPEHKAAVSALITEGIVSGAVCALVCTGAEVLFYAAEACGAGDEEEEPKAKDKNKAKAKQTKPNAEKPARVKAAAKAKAKEKEKENGARRQEAVCGGTEGELEAKRRVVSESEDSGADEPSEPPAKRQKTASPEPILAKGNEM
ncbi:uncharacterized protein BXZ73DRAFT_98579 [Epithele typhae]|uniref:uncharacterized protein n=1 Tax=Epithele typhae TaxID=378194 RepID=UPI002007DB44|nr:uncharacterized protein BXZ73DRAFT_98579 [Epithele typhae]KAH9940748.1 hypothetical protein BXZ73DRAFT_98579 [Epithele typhae]